MRQQFPVLVDFLGSVQAESPSVEEVVAVAAAGIGRGAVAVGASGHAA